MPRSFAAVFKGMVNRASPMKRKVLEEKGVVRSLDMGEEVICQSLKQTIGMLETSMTEENRKKYHIIASACRTQRKYGFIRKISRKLGIGGCVHRKKRNTSFQRGKRKMHFNKQ